MTVSSTGQAAEFWPESMGHFKITKEINAEKPVWQSMVKDDRFLFYNGRNIKPGRKKIIHPHLVFYGVYFFSSKLYESTICIIFKNYLR